jgi:histone H3/H4
MTNPLLFPASKMREIASADPDVKDISKQAIDVLRQASQLFAHSLLTKCHDEARRRKRLTTNFRDFLSVAMQDDALRPMLGPFIADIGLPPIPDSDPSDADPDPDLEPDLEPDEEDQDEDEDDPRVPSAIDQLLSRDS